MARGAEQHGRVAVVATGVHLAGNCRAVRGPCDLLNVERIHIGAQRDHAVASEPALERADDARFGDSLDHLEAPRAQPFSDQRRGTNLLEAGLG